MELILVRHGQPAWTTPEGMGRNDPGLTDLGHAQAAAAAGRLADHGDEPAPGPVDRLFVSPAVRAVETAAPISSTLGLPVEVREWMWELRNPDDWEGAPIDQIEQAFVELRGRPLADIWDGVPGGEPLRDFHDRIIGGLHGELAGLDVKPTDDHRLWHVGPDAPERVVMVAHGGTNSTIVAHLLGVQPEPWEWDRFTMGHASVALLRTVPLAGANLWSLRALGDANHLPLDDRTV
ncbi:MAG: Alpha-ribazole-5-phosphate phosphatase [Acidimicrobiales bacterium]|nr:Alpha-ribazole-5-phosphate phosphatase [Acidimicrobiales bacterium]